MKFTWPTYFLLLRDLRTCMFTLFLLTDACNDWRTKHQNGIQDQAGLSLWDTWNDMFSSKHWRQWCENKWNSEVRSSTVIQRWIITDANAPFAAAWWKGRVFIYLLLENTFLIIGVMIIFIALEGPCHCKLQMDYHSVHFPPPTPAYLAKLFIYLALCFSILHFEVV